MERRFIPAGAGNTSIISLQSISLTVHPRGCGEHAVTILFGIAFIGSSPRVRGTLTRKCEQQPGVRFIPAGAGNTGLSRSRVLILPVHPRGSVDHGLCLDLIVCVYSSWKRV